MGLGQRGRDLEKEWVIGSSLAIQHYIALYPFIFNL